MTKSRDAIIFTLNVLWVLHYPKHLCTVLLIAYCWSDVVLSIMFVFLNFFCSHDMTLWAWWSGNKTLRMLSKDVFPCGLYCLSLLSGDFDHSISFPPFPHEKLPIGGKSMEYMLLFIVQCDTSLRPAVCMIMCNRWLCKWNIDVIILK